MAVYKIIFKGEIKNERYRSKTEAALAKLFNINAAKASVLFNGKSYALKKGLTQGAAELMQRKLNQIGVVSYLIREETITDEITCQSNMAVKNKSEGEPQNKKSTCLDCGSTDIMDW
ncbi:MAG: hypothetical protein V5789_10120 [Colwellia sp.]